MNITNLSLPQFNHPEVKVFYEYDLSVPKERVEPILQLPRQTLIEDLETIIMDLIERADYFKTIDDPDQHLAFLQHALWMLIELDAKEALPTILKLLQQDNDFNWYWLGDFSTEHMWEVLYHLGVDELETLKTFVLTPGEWINRIVPSSALEQVALHQPEKRTEIIEWYRSILDAFLAMEDSDKALDGEVVSSIVGDLINIKAKTLLPQIKALADRSLIYTGLVGDYDSIKRMIAQPSAPYDKRKVHHSIFERYKEAMTWHGYRMKYDEAYQKENTYTPPDPMKVQKEYTPNNSVGTFKRKGKKIGRNDPCPCGSGKKYKKCCLNK